MLKIIALAWKVLWRDIRSGHWTIVFIALVLAISSSTSLSFFTDRLARGIDQQSAAFAGGNLIVTSPTPIPLSWLKAAEGLNLRTAQAWLYLSVVSSGEKMQLANIQAISTSYPLLGDAKVSPASKTILVEPRLLDLLSLKNKGKITLGTATFTVSKLINKSTLDLSAGWTIAPRVIMRIDDVASTKTVIPGSKVDYRLLLAGEKNNLDAFTRWVAGKLNSGQLVQDAASQQKNMKEIIGKVTIYFQLVVLLCLMLCGIAIAFSVRQYMQRHFEHIALWRCLGAREHQILSVFLLQFFLIALLSGSVGIFAGYGLQRVFINMLNDVMHMVLPQAGIAPIILGFSVSFILLFSFAYPVLSQLPKVSPIYLWRNLPGLKIGNSWNYIYIPIIVLLLGGYWYLNYDEIVFMFFGVLIITATSLYIITDYLLGSLRYFLRYTDGPIRRGISEITQHSDRMSLQLIGFTLIVSTFFILGWFKNDLLKDWRLSFMEGIPNFFAFNIALDDLPGVKELFLNKHITIDNIYPMVRGRLILSNDKPILSVIPNEAKSHNALHRELNLSSMMSYPADNKIIKGAAWVDGDINKPVISIEQELAYSLHLNLGDKLTFQIGNNQLSGIINNIRTVKWSSFHPNFYIIFPLGVLDDFPKTYITSFHLKSNQLQILNEMTQQFPNITILDVASLLKQIQESVTKISIALQYLFMYLMIVGLLIFITSLQSTMDERRRTYKLLHILGAGKKFIRLSMIVEFSLLTCFVIVLSLLTSVAIMTLLGKYLEV